MHNLNWILNPYDNISSEDSGIFFSVDSLKKKLLGSYFVSGGIEKYTPDWIEIRARVYLSVTKNEKNRYLLNFTKSVGKFKR